MLTKLFFNWPFHEGGAKNVSFPSNNPSLLFMS